MKKSITRLMTLGLLMSLSSGVHAYFDTSKNVSKLCNKYNYNRFIHRNVVYPKNKGCNLENADLMGANLSGLNLSGANMKGAKLNCAIFSEKTNLENTNFLGARVSLERLQVSSTYEKSKNLDKIYEIINEDCKN